MARASPAPDEGDARLSSFAGRLGLRLAVIGGGLTVLAGFAYIYTAWSVVSAAGDPAFRVDFRVFWAAARLAVDGTPLDAFDTTRLADIHGVTQEDWMPWVYPPSFLLALQPLGTLNFFAAWTLYTILSVAALVFAVRPFAGGVRPVWLGIALAPAVLVSLLLGQVSIPWAAGLLAGLSALRSERYWLAGMFFGLLTMKPQLGLLIPVAVIAAGHWRSFFAAGLTTAATLAVATGVYGLDYWPAMLEVADRHLATLRSQTVHTDRMISLYSGLAALGLPERLAFTVQSAMGLVAAIVVAVAWGNRRVPFDLAAAVLLTAIPLTTPYLWHNESALFAPALLFLVRAGALPTSGPALAIALAMWIGLGPQTLAHILTGGDVSLSPRGVAVPLMLLGFAVACMALLRQLRSHADAPRG